MSYVKALDILPEEVLRIIQEYVEGECIYIPKKSANKKAWGEMTQSKVRTAERNKQMFMEYKSGKSVKELAESYFLSYKTVQRIIRMAKRED